MSIQFSIVIPTYNRGELLLRTIESLLNQTFKDFEIIVIDDGSTDNTEELVRAIESPLIKYHRVSNRERGAARNAGTKKAKGKYINFFDSDDLAYPNHLEIAYQQVEKLEFPEVFAVSYDIRNDRDNIIKEVKLKSNVADFIARGNDLSCNGVFVKREIALSHLFCEDRALSGSEDYELWLRLAAQFSFPCSPVISHSVIQHEGRSTMNFDPEPLIIRKQKMLEYAFSNKEVKMRFGKQKKKMESGAASYIALHIALTGTKKGLAIKWWLNSISRSPISLFSKRSAAILKHLL